MCNKVIEVTIISHLQKWFEVMRKIKGKTFLIDICEAQRDNPHHIDVFHGIYISEFILQNYLKVEKQRRWNAVDKISNNSASKVKYSTMEYTIVWS